MRKPIPRWTWIAAGGVLIVSMLKTSTKKSGFSVDSEGLGALARMLVVEHSGGSDAEKAQIVWVALNRAKAADAPVERAVAPGARKAIRGVQSGTWNGSPAYAEKYAKASSSPSYLGALQFVGRVVQGAFSDEGYNAFIHPVGMPKPPCAEGRYELNTFQGPRCVPQWGLTPRARVGEAYFYVV